jgi:hypothetical protein
MSRFLTLVLFLTIAGNGAWAADEITERAVRNPLQSQKAPVFPGAAGSGGTVSSGAAAGAAGGGAAAGAAAQGSAGTATAGGGVPAGGSAGSSSGAAAAGAAAQGGAAPGSAAGGGAGSARLSLDETVARLQQQVQSLSAQVAALQSVLIVSQAGAILRAPTLTLQSLNATTIQSNQGIAITAGQNIAMQSDAGTTINARGSALVESSGTLDLKGRFIKLNGGTRPLATVGSQVQVPGQPIGQVLTGSQTILGN